MSHYMLLRHAGVVASRRSFLGAAIVSACATGVRNDIVAAGFPNADGPYLQAGTDARVFLARWLERAAGNIHEAWIATGSCFEVQSGDALPAFDVMLRVPEPVEPSVLTSAPKRLFVMADTHGEFAIMVETLRAHNVIDDQLNWFFGRGSLVVLGDMLDRGDRQIEILWLLYELERQAELAGGSVHVLLGNHEAMVLRGDLRYLNPFYSNVAQALGAATYADLLGPDTVLGQWLRSKNAVMRINGMLFAHGGISPALLRSGLSLDEINTGVRASLSANADTTDPTRTLVMGEDGPLWYRGYFADQTDFEIASGADIDAVLARYEASAIFVGHTIVETVTPLHEGRVIAVQVYPHRDDAGQAVMEAVVVEEGQIFRATIDGRRELIGAVHR